MDEICDTKFGKTVFSYSQEQPLYEKIREERPDIVWVNGFDNDIEKQYLSDPSENKLLILDDQMETLCNDLNFQTFFTKKSHHMNISVIFMVQNVYYRSKCMCTINLNTTSYALFKSPRDMSQVHTLARQLYPGNSNYVIESYKEATKIPFGYLLLDIDPRTPDAYRLRTRILPGEEMIIYRERS